MEGQPRQAASIRQEAFKGSSRRDALSGRPGLCHKAARERSGQCACARVPDPDGSQDEGSPSRAMAGNRSCQRRVDGPGWPHEGEARASRAAIAACRCDRRKNGRGQDRPVRLLWPTLDKPLSNMSLEMVLRRMKAQGVTVHGFRSSFRDWAGEETHFPRELCEAALAHAVGNAAEQAYRRGDALEKRRALMTEWAAFVSASAGSS
jgi:hypothetical protein